MKIGDFLQSQIRKIAYVLRASDAFPQLPVLPPVCAALRGSACCAACAALQAEGSICKNICLCKTEPMSRINYPVAQSTPRGMLDIISFFRGGFTCFDGRFSAAPRAAIYASQDVAYYSKKSDLTHGQNARLLQLSCILAALDRHSHMGTLSHLLCIF